MYVIVFIMARDSNSLQNRAGGANLVALRLLCGMRAVKRLSLAILRDPRPSINHAPAAMSSASSAGHSTAPETGSRKTSSSVSRCLPRIWEPWQMLAISASAVLGTRLTQPRPDIASEPFGLLRFLRLPDWLPTEILRFLCALRVPSGLRFPLAELDLLLSDRFESRHLLARDGLQTYSKYRIVPLPLMKNEILAAAFVSWVLSTAQFTASFHTCGQTQPWSVLVASDFRFNLSPKPNALAILIVLLNILTLFVNELFLRRAIRRRTSTVPRSSAAQRRAA